MIKPFTPAPLLRRYEKELAKETHINRVLARSRKPATYVEIGVRDGECIRQIRSSRRIAIDPAPLALDSPNWVGVTVHQLTSDAYFSDVAGSELKPGVIDAALADGLHEFRQTLRDVLNLERYMAPSGVIFIHDCNPPTRKHAEDSSGPWNGDVWKVAYYLQRYRPDLSYFTLDCDWGLGVVKGFSGGPRRASERDIAMVEKLDYSVLEQKRRKILNLRSPLLASLLIG